MARGGDSGRDHQARGRGRPRLEHAPDPAHVERIALTAFAAAGYDGASVRQIAASAGVDPALVTRRYGSKFGLWQATVDQLAARMTQMHAAIVRLDDDLPPPARFRQALRLFVAFCCEIPELGRFFTDEIANPGERRDYVLDRIWRPNFAILQPLIRYAQDMGVVRAGDADILVFQVIGMVSMPLMMTPVIETELGARPEQIHDRLLHSLERLLLNA